ncbi:MAG: phosphoribosylformylglycinamidine synthase subunit PurS [Balneolaceae bacterium]
MYKATINVTLRKSILDPKGKATHHALQNLGLNDITDVRIGKFIELNINTDDKARARELADTASSKLLANEVMEDYQIEIKKA